MLIFPAYGKNWWFFLILFFLMVLFVKKNALISAIIWEIELKKIHLFQT